MTSRNMKVGKLTSKRLKEENHGDGDGGEGLTLSTLELMRQNFKERFPGEMAHQIEMTARTEKKSQGASTTPFQVTN